MADAIQKFPAHRKNSCEFAYMVVGPELEQGFGVTVVPENY